MPGTTRYTKHYFWNTRSNDILGQGATSTVFKGFHRTTGVTVAVKTLTYKSDNEFEILKKINHENIVKLVAIEEEETTIQPKPLVIITELCAGGCLDLILTQPENVHGLPDSEFLLVLKHLYQGMKYLREKDMIHRDLKPGNIMKCISDDGTVTYKLIDFGTARELPEEGVFKSLHGTVEYLRPDMYKKAMLNQYVKDSLSFNANVDLWSTGVTLYHIATGKLPFVPYGGRRNTNKTIMHYITSKKASGVISGVQKEKNGPIHWSSELPASSLLSPSLKRLITPLLAGLMESDNSKIWSFDKFFKETEEILSRRLVHVFFVNHPTLLKLYLPSERNLENLQEQLLNEGINFAQKTHVVLHKSTVLDNDCIPPTTEDNPLFLIHKEDNHVLVNNIEIPSNAVSFTMPPKRDEDMKQAKQACCQAFVIKREIEKLLSSAQLIEKFTKQFSAYMKKNCEDLQQQNQYMVKRLRDFKRTTKLLLRIQETSSYKLKSLLDSLESISELCEGLTHGVSSLNQKLTESLYRELPEVKQSALTHAGTLSDILLTIKDYIDQYPVPISECYLNSYLLERKKFRSYQTRLFKVLNEVWTQFEVLCKKFEDYYNLMQVDLVKMEVLTSNLSDMDKKLSEFEEQLDKQTDNYYQHSENRTRSKGEIVKQLQRYQRTSNVDAVLKENQKESRELNSISVNYSSSLKNLLSNIKN